MNSKSVLIAVYFFIVFIGTFCTAGIVYQPAYLVSGGEEHTLILTQANNAYSCGDNSVYQLGDGTYNDRIIPVPVHGVNDVNYLQDIIDISAGWQHSLFLGQNGQVFACGSDSYGCLGNGDNGARINRGR
ncbi:MAG: hypothetical protein NTW93_06455 [Phycisphaerae bacterium]|nr:hypothetical protein [Phycisphaerae bacterium]